MTTIINIDPTAILTVLDERGWTKGTYAAGDGGAVCLHGAIRLCSPVPGDAHLIERVAVRQGWGTGWNDEEARTELEVRELLAKGVHITDADLAATFGPNWAAVVEVVRTVASATPHQLQSLGAALGATLGAAWDAAWGAARDADLGAATVAVVAVVWDLATEDSPFTFAHRDILMGPWVSVFGLPKALEETK